jgi:hypothetical protein
MIGLLLQLAVTIGPIDSLHASPATVSDSAQLAASWTLTQKPDSQRVFLDGGAGPVTSMRVARSIRAASWWVYTSTTTSSGRWRLCVHAWRRGRLATACRARYFTTPLPGSIRSLPADTSVTVRDSLTYCTFFKWQNGAHVHAANNRRPLCDRYLSRYMSLVP